jgi:hypothetical protein
MRAVGGRQRSAKVQLRSWFTSLVAGLGLLLTVSAAQAAVLPVGGGWQFDQISSSNVVSDNSPWTFTLTGPGVFSVVDAFAVGDVYQVFSTSGLEATTAFALLPAAWTPGATTPDFAWVNPAFSRAQIALGAGTYSYDVFASLLPGGAPAGFFVRADLLQTEVVPAPAALALFGIGLLGLAAVRRRA